MEAGANLGDLACPRTTTVALRSGGRPGWAIKRPGVDHGDPLGGLGKKRAW